MNELARTGSDISRMKTEKGGGQKGVAPLPRNEASNFLNYFRGEDYDNEHSPILPIEFRLDRMIRLVHITPRSIEESLKQFDKVVAIIETCRGKEILEGRVMQNWRKNPSDESTCTACDAKTFCPDFHLERMPKLPAKRAVV